MGLFLVIEWSPKLFAYFLGGYLVSHLGTRNSYLLVEASRALAAMACAALVLFGSTLSTIVIVCSLGALASVFQMMNAVANVVLDVSTSTLLPQESRIRGFTTLAIADALAGLIILPLGGFMIKSGVSEVAVLVLAATIFVAGLLNTLLFSLMFRSGAHPLLDPCSAKKFSPLAIVTEATLGLRYVARSPVLMWLTLNSFVNNMTVAFLSYNSPAILHSLFTLNGAAASAVTNVAITTAPESSYIGFVKASTCLALFLFSLAVTFRPLTKSHQRKAAVLGQAAIGVAIVFATTMVSQPATFLAAAIVVNLGDLLWRVWQKGARQQNIPPEKRIGVTGILIMNEAAGYVAAGILMAACHVTPQLGGYLLSSVMACCLLSGLVLKRWLSGLHATVKNEQDDTKTTTAAA